MSEFQKGLKDFVVKEERKKENFGVDISSSLLLEVMRGLIKRPLLLWPNLSRAETLKDLYRKEQSKAALFGNLKKRLRDKAESIYEQREALELSDDLYSSSLENNPGMCFYCPASSYPLLQIAEKKVSEDKKILWISQTTPYENGYFLHEPRTVAFREFEPYLWRYDDGKAVAFSRIRLWYGFSYLVLPEDRGCEWLAETGITDYLERCRHDCVFFEFPCLFLDSPTVPQKFINMVKTVKRAGKEVYVAAAISITKNTNCTPYKEISEAVNAAPT